MSPKEKNSGSTASLQEKFSENAKDSEATIEELQQKLTEAEEKVAEHWDRILRMQAESNNMHERMKRDVENAHKFGLKKFALELLPVVDNLERAIDSHLADPSGEGSLLAGVELTLKMFYSALSKCGIEVVDPKDKAFNPEFHEAVSTVEDSGAKPGTVMTVLQKGYILNERLIRPALVVVAK
jgi:molecular chaperone GrpE